MAVSLAVQDQYSVKSRMVRIFPNFAGYESRQYAAASQTDDRIKIIGGNPRQEGTVPRATPLTDSIGLLARVAQGSQIRWLSVAQGLVKIPAASAHFRFQELIPDKKAGQNSQSEAIQPWLNH